MLFANLLGAPAEIEHLVGGGRNSRIYHVRSGSKEFALKQYPSRADDPRDRLSTEVGALTLMERYRIDTVPACRRRGPRTRLCAAELDRRRCPSPKLPDADIDAAAHFLAAIHALRTTPWAEEQPAAAEACLSGAEIERQIAARLARLRALSGEGALASFLQNDFVPVLERESVNAKATIQAAGLDFAADLPQEWRSLVPSDFGFHNSLRRKDGSLAFVDFEYFGWDDPVKLSADILLHPGRTLAAPQRRRFRRAACRPLWRRSLLCGAARRLSAAVRVALGAHPSQRVHPRTLAAARARRRERKLGGRQGDAACACVGLSRRLARQSEGRVNGHQRRSRAIYQALPRRRSMSGRNICASWWCARLKAASEAISARRCR